MSEPQAKDPQTGRFLSAPRKNPRNLQHGVELYLRTGRLPSVRGRRLLARYLREFEKELRESQGGDLTPQREAMLRQVLRCENVLRLIELYLLRASPMRPGEFRKGRLELQPCLAQSYGHFLNVQRQALLALGLDRKEAPGPTLESIIAEHDARKRARNAQDGRSPSQAAAGQGEDVQTQAEVQGEGGPGNGAEDA